MNAADRLKQFLDGIDVYVSCRNLTPTKFSEEFALAETLTLEQMDKLTLAAKLKQKYVWEHVMPSSTSEGNL